MEYITGFQKLANTWRVVMSFWFFDRTWRRSKKNLSANQEQERVVGGRSGARAEYQQRGAPVSVDTEKLCGGQSECAVRDKTPKLSTLLSHSISCSLTPVFVRVSAPQVQRSNNISAAEGQKKQPGFWLQRTKEKKRKCLSSSRRWTGCRAGARCSLWIPWTPMWSGWSTPSAVPSCSGPCRSRRSSARSVRVSEALSEWMHPQSASTPPFSRALRQRVFEREASSAKKK